MGQLFHEIRLELVRPGPPHNQLLSPLTAYLALCGDGSPITFHIEMEHHQLLSRLERLRYTGKAGGQTVAVADRVREATVQELGGEIAKIFAEVRTLLAEEWRAFGESATRGGADRPQLIQLRLVVSGSELSIIPFEIAVSPAAFPGEGFELALQSHMPNVLTREIRRSRPVPVSWRRSFRPRILLVSAEPRGLRVPLRSHVQVLREAVEDWVDRPGESPVARLPSVKEHLRVLSQASVEDIKEICSKESFTHVHVLAHGIHDEVAGETRFGVALCEAGNPQNIEVVSGKRLAKALQTERADGSSRSTPTLVTLSTCDSGAQGSVLVPGGSIAHDLHAEGIPWVIASQFPLTTDGSIRMTRELYKRLLRGDDPRQALFEVRRELFMSAKRDHDWASLVAYASMPSDFDRQVADFFESQMKRAIDVALRHVDSKVNANETNGTDTNGSDESVSEAFSKALSYLDLWERRLPEDDTMAARELRAECYGMRGSTLKRIALHYLSLRHPPSEADRKEANAKFKEALASYRKGLDQWADVLGHKAHWLISQTLSLSAVLGRPRDPDTHSLALALARQSLRLSPRAADQAWAHGSLAEIEMLSLYHVDARPRKVVEKAIEDHCRAIIALAGIESFQVESTRRQFQRYIDHWQNKAWDGLPQVAIREFAVGKS